MRKNNLNQETPRPWVLEIHTFYGKFLVKENICIGGVHSFSDKDLNLILKSVNSYDVLVKALELVDESMKKGVIDDGCYLETRIRNKPAHAISVHDVVKKALAQAKGE